MRFEETFDTAPESAAGVRRFVRRHTPGDVDIDLVVLLATELATNALLHAGTPFAVAVVVEVAEMTVEVVDTNPTLPAMVDRGERESSGRGLRMVDVGAASWGVERAGPGKRIWFAVKRAAAP